MGTSTEERLIELETRFAYQEESVRVLSDAVADQQKQIDRLQLICRDLHERLRAQSDSVQVESSPADEVPPPY